VLRQIGVEIVFHGEKIPGRAQRKRAKDKASGIIYHLICPRRVRIRGLYKILFSGETQDRGTQLIEI
jgi:hypothetical protein